MGQIHRRGTEMKGKEEDLDGMHLCTQS